MPHVVVRFGQFLLFIVCAVGPEFGSTLNQLNLCQNNTNSSRLNTPFGGTGSGSPPTGSVEHPIQAKRATLATPITVLTREFQALTNMFSL